MASQCRHASVFSITVARVSFLVLAGADCDAPDARELSSIDRLRTAASRGALAPFTPHATTLKNAAAEGVTSVHVQLGVPTFLWGPGHGGVATEKAAAASVDPALPPEAAARAHLRAFSHVYALPANRADEVPVLFTQPLQHGGTLVKFRNRIDGIEVFREEAAVMLGRERELIAIGGYVSGGEASAPFAIEPAAAVGRALADWSFGSEVEALLVETESRDDYRYFDLPAGTLSADGSRLGAPARIKRVLFRLPGQLRPAWYAEVQIHDGLLRGAHDYYAYVIAADDGEVLFRHNQTAEAAFTYRTFAESGTLLPLPSPLGRNGFPHPTGTPDNYQGAFVPQNVVTLQNLPFSRNDPWLPAGATQTTGNNVDAYADLVAPNNFSAGDLRATTTSAGTFDYTHDPTQNPGASDAQRKASIVNLFYVTNWLHDWFYDAGFDEAAGNAQTDNFSRGGAANDALVAQAQDYSGRNNANMFTPADGSMPRMQMFIYDAVRGGAAVVLSPAQISGGKTAYAPPFGPKTAVVLSVAENTIPANGCAAIVPAVTGKIALIDEDGFVGSYCDIKEKVLNAQAAGAVGAIIIASADGALPAANPTWNNPYLFEPVIPSILISKADGTALRTALATLGPVLIQVQVIAGPDRDGTLSNGIIAHEWGHYISNRLIGNASGLTQVQSRGMGEGWGDFHDLLMLIKASDAALPNNAGFGGTYAHGGYTSGGAGNFLGNGMYYSSRRYPYSRDMTKNPLTFKHVENGVQLPASPEPRFGQDGSYTNEVHSIGEVWASMLWECYSNLLNDTARLTFDEAQDRMKRYLVTGYKLTPVVPTFVEARDALLAAMAGDPADQLACRQGFSKRGLGSGAVAPDRYDSLMDGAVESFSEPYALAITALGISDRPGYCDADEKLDMGESGALFMTLKNIGLNTLSHTTGSVGTSNPKLKFPNGQVFSIPSIAPAAAVTVVLPVELNGVTGVDTVDVSATVSDTQLTTPGVIGRNVRALLNADLYPAQSATDDVEALQSVWTAGTSSDDPGSVWRQIAIALDEHVWFGPDNYFSYLTWLQSPPLFVAATGNFSFTFRHRFSFDIDGASANDGGQIQISTDNGAHWTDIGGFATPGYNGVIAAGFGNPLAGLPAFIAKSNIYPEFQTVTVNLGTAYAGKTVRVRFALGTDGSGNGDGWQVDDIAFINITNTPFTAVVPDAHACVTVEVASGNPQWALIDTAYPAPLKALVKSAAGVPVAGAQVTFAPPASGASVAFGGLATVRANASGIATAPAATANGVPGAFLVTVKAGSSATANYDMNNRLTVPNLDVDGSTTYDPLSDGLMIFRRLSGVSDTTLTNGVLGTGASRTPATIASYIDGIKPLLDIDGNGVVEAATDGMLMIRHLMGWRGSALTGGIVDPKGTRKAAVEIESYLQSMTPP
jgi:hypothetical protein